MTSLTTRFMFEINTTCSEPILICIDGNTTLSQFREFIAYEIEHFTMLTHLDIRDVFVIKDDLILSFIDNHFITIHDFIRANSFFFGSFNNSTIYNNIFPIYIIDSIYLERIANGLETPLWQSNYQNNYTRTYIKDYLIDPFRAFIGI